MNEIIKERNESSFLNVFLFMEAEKFLGGAVFAGEQTFEGNKSLIVLSLLFGTHPFKLQLLLLVLSLAGLSRFALQILGSHTIVAFPLLPFLGLAELPADGEDALFLSKIFDVSLLESKSVFWAHCLGTLNLGTSHGRKF